MTNNTKQSQGGQAVRDTPRTDEAQFGTGRVSVDFARQLERELNAANAKIKWLEEAGDALKAAGYFGGWADAVNNWIKVRDAKP